MFSYVLICKCVKSNSYAAMQHPHEKSKNWTHFYQYLFRKQIKTLIMKPPKCKKLKKKPQNQTLIFKHQNLMHKDFLLLSFHTSIPEIVTHHLVHTFSHASVKT